MYYIFSFRSRNQSMRFYEALKRSGVYSQLITTPRSIAIGCGLSVKVNDNDFLDARDVFFQNNYETFAGVFFNSNNGLERIYL